MEIVKEHLAQMQTMCRILPDEDLPAKLVDKYWSLKRCIDRIGSPLTPSDLARLCVECGYGKPNVDEVKGPDVARLWRNKTIGPGTEVLVEWRGKKEPGKLVMVTSGNEIVVALECTGDERRFGVDRVSMAA